MVFLEYAKNSINQNFPSSYCLWHKQVKQIIPWKNTKRISQEKESVQLYGKCFLEPQYHSGSIFLASLVLFKQITSSKEWTILLSFLSSVTINFQNNTTRLHQDAEYSKANSRDGYKSTYAVFYHVIFCCFQLSP